MAMFIVLFDVHNIDSVNYESVFTCKLKILTERARESYTKAYVSKVQGVPS